MSKKRSWWLILIAAVILILSVLTAVFWDTVVLYAAPKTVLRTALTQTVEVLENRFREDPVWILLRAAEPEGNYTADVKLETNYDVLGTTSFDMKISTDLSANQIAAVGTVKTANTQLPLSVYLDPNFMSVSSDELLGGNCYGITYDTFGADIRSIPLLTFLVPEETIQGWETSVSDVKEAMLFDYAVPQLPQISEEDMQKVMLAILALPCKAAQEELHMRGTPYQCRKLTYSAGGETVAGILGQVWNGAEGENASVSVSFWLWEKTLIRTDISAAAGDHSVSMSLELGTDPAVDPLFLQIIQSRNGAEEKTAITVNTQWVEAWYLQSWNIQTEQDVNSVSYHWNPAEGSMKLFLDEQEEEIALTLTEAETGITVATEDFAQLLDALSRDGTGTPGEDISCEATIFKGSEVVTPAYKNLDQWTLKDFMVLLNGLGSLLKLEIS